MEEWAIVKRHAAHEITLLCDQHHREKTSGLLPKEKVRQCNDNPFNIQNGIAAPHFLHYSGSTVEFEIGSNIIRHNDPNNSFIALGIDGAVLVGFTFEEGEVLINATFFDEFNNPFLAIRQNQLTISTSPWDVERVGTTLTIRSAERNILLEIEFTPPSKIKITQGRLIFNGVEILVRPTHIYIPNCNNLISGTTMDNNAGGFIFGNQPHPCAFTIRNIPRYLKDRATIIREEKAAVRERGIYAE